MSRIVKIMNSILSSGRGEIIVATHDGNFHMDELASIFLIDLGKKDTDAYNLKLEIIRSRNSEDYDEADIVLDVGAKYEGKYFDHHQEDYRVRDKATIDLVWSDMRNPIVRQLIREHQDEYGHGVEWINDLYVRRMIFNKIHATVISLISASDIGKVQNSKEHITLADYIMAMGSVNEIGEDNSVEFMRAYDFVKTMLTGIMKNQVKRAIEEHIIRVSMLQVVDGIHLVPSPSKLEKWFATYHSKPEDFKHLDFVIRPLKNNTGYVVTGLNDIHIPSMLRYRCFENIIYVCGDEIKVLEVFKNTNSIVIEGDEYDARKFAKWWKSKYRDAPKRHSCDELEHNDNIQQDVIECSCEQLISDI